MWGRFTNIAQNVQDRLDTVVENVNKSMNEEPSEGDTSVASGSGDASFASAADASFASSSDAHDQLNEQTKLLNQLKDMIRQKDKQLLESNAKLSKFKLQAKAKITSLTNQIGALKKAGGEPQGDEESSSAKVSHATLIFGSRWYR
ncbi:uncharacterized protein LOC119740269 [Patiria miniata]|uniref:Uncharacterized protein n=1 Tax=Patiria miniata TaxID=46514 RepID=A0A914B5T5_PATMI|nr:uncharacterized protein LOC119740269 [Patiria miniata]